MDLFRTLKPDPDNTGVGMRLYISTITALLNRDAVFSSIGIEVKQGMTQVKDVKMRALCEGAIMVAMATVLSLIKIIQLPQGGTISLGMFPVFVYCKRWGAKQGFKCSFAYGLIQLIIDGAYAWGPSSMLLDYIIAFGVLGVCGLFAKKKNGFYIGITAASFCRFVVHFISGVTIYRIYAPTEVFNMTLANPYVYSAVYNGSFMAIDWFICLLMAVLLNKRLSPFLNGYGDNI